jgi:hypothetical protein
MEMIHPCIGSARPLFTHAPFHDHVDPTLDPPTRARLPARAPRLGTNSGRNNGGDSSGASSEALFNLNQAQTQQGRTGSAVTVALQTAKAGRQNPLTRWGFGSVGAGFGGVGFWVGSLEMIEKAKCVSLPYRAGFLGGKLFWEKRAL